MLNFEDILYRLKSITGKEKNKDIAQILGTTEANFSRWLARNKIPYEQIVNFCVNENIDIKYILIGTKTDLNTINSNNNNNNGKIINVQGHNNHVNIRNMNDEQLKVLEELKKLPEKRQKYYYHIISAEALETEE